MFEKIKKYMKAYQKGQMGLQDLPKIVLFLCIAGLVAAYVLSLMTTVQGTMTANSTAYNATGQAMTGIGNLTAIFGSIGSIAGIVVVVGLLIAGFWFLMRK